MIPPNLSIKYGPFLPPSPLLSETALGSNSHVGWRGQRPRSTIVSSEARRANALGPPRHDDRAGGGERNEQTMGTPIVEYFTYTVTTLMAALAALVVSKDCPSKWHENFIKTLCIGAEDTRRKWVRLSLH